MKVVDSTKCYHENLMSFANLPEMHYFIIAVSIGWRDTRCTKFPTPLLSRMI